MKWNKQELPIIETEEHLTTALALYEQLSNKEDTDPQFLYLLRLIIADYESKHYPIALSSTVGFILSLIYYDYDVWEPDIIIIMLLVLLIDFIWLTTYLLSL